MSSFISLAELNYLISATAVHFHEKKAETIARGVTTDTRTLKPGDVFVALEGENFNGHDFIPQALEKGAIALITNTTYSEDLPDSITQFKVANPLKAYQKIGRGWRDKFEIPIIGITGSVGKTTTKELMAAVLSTQGKVHKTQANYNNEIGVPKTLLQLQEDHDYAVIEMAMRGRGEIAELTEIARPTIGVITNVGTAHIGRLGSEDAIAQAKCELLATMPQTSVAILNHDNDRLIRTAATVWNGETLTYGLEGGDIQGKMLDSQTLEVNGMQLPLPLPGRHNALNYLAALAVTKVLNIDWQPLTAGITVQMPSGRSQRLSLPGNITILDETYNAGLESMLAALSLLNETPGKRHIAVLGTMKELGARSRDLHAQVGEKVKELNLDTLLVLIDDPEAQAIATTATGIPTECFTNREDIVNWLQENVQPGDCLLFKASNSVGLSKVVQEFSSFSS